ncbi:MAG: S1-like domain-containing RNA-binding protein [Brumimicrobium sp.]|nr:S1-like domain-containing RNA-binding protein [Brumimicrobium sp.]
MAKIGEYNVLIIDRFTSVGAFLKDNEGFEVLLPKKYLTDEMTLDGEVEIFLYKDSEDRPVATTEKPYVTLNNFAFLKVKETTDFGAFMDWGLEKDLLIPFKEQTVKMKTDGIYLIHLSRDPKTDRLVGSARINKFLSKEPADLKVGDQVDLFVAEMTDLGRKVIVNNTFGGLIFKDRIIKPLRDGERLKGYVEYIRTDGKLDISLVPVGVERFDQFSEKILEYLKKHGGEMSLNDNTDPDIIRNELGMSKKSFKKGLGNLYKRNLVSLEKEKVVLL